MTEQEPRYSYDDVHAATLSYFSGDTLATNVWVDKYALRDRGGLFLEMTPDDMHRRLAKEFARIENKYPNPLKAEEIYEHFKEFEEIIAQGSPMSGVGNEHQIQSLSNCFTLDSPLDSYGSILHTDQELIQLAKRRGGIGFSISNIRPKGEPTANAARTTDGIGVFMERYSNSTREVAQCIEENQKVLTSTGLKAIKNVKTQELIWTRNGWVKNLETIESGKKEVFQILSGAGNTILTSKDHIFHTRDGNKRLSELREGGDISLIRETPEQLLCTNNVEGEHGIVNTKVDVIEYVGVRKTYDLSLEKEHFFWCEGFYVHNSNRRGALIMTMDCRHPELLTFINIKKDRKKVTGANISIQWRDEFFHALEKGEKYTLRWPCECEVEDAQVVKEVDPKEIWDAFIGAAWDCAEPGALFWDTVLREGTADIYPEYRSVSCNPCCFAADSEVQVETKNGTKKINQITELDSVWDHKEQLWRTPTNYFKAHNSPLPEYPVYRIEFDNGEHFLVTRNHKFAKRTNNPDSFVLEELKNLKPGDVVATKEGKPDTKITSIEYHGIDEVGCIEVPDSNHFVVDGGIISGNSEITLSPYDSCRLMIINLMSCVTNHFLSNAEFDYKKLIKLARVGQRLMDDLVDLEIEAVDRILEKVKNDPEPEHVKRIEIDLWNNVKKAALGGRRTGLGITALGDTIASLSVKYGSNESIEITEKIYRALAVGSHYESLVLAEERNHFPVFDYELEKDHEFLNRIMDAVETEFPGAKKMWRTTGRRNIANTTTAPTGSSSLLSKVTKKLFGTTSGVEPTIFLEFVRKRRVNPDHKNVTQIDNVGDSWEEYVVNPSGIKFWKQATGETDVEKSPYSDSTCENIDWINSIQLQATAQRWVDHSISKCLAGDKNHLVHTSRGLKYIEDIVKEHTEEGFYPVEPFSTINSEGKLVNVTSGYFNGEKPCLKVTFVGGERLVGTPEHKIMILNESYGFSWKKLSELTDTDYMVSRKGLKCFGSPQLYFSSLLGVFDFERRTNSKKVLLPKRASREFARFLGYIISDGHISQNSFGLTQVDEGVSEDFILLVKSLFGLDCHVGFDKRSQGLKQIIANSRIVTRFLKEYLDIGEKKYVPEVIFQCFGANQVREFIKGLTLDGYVSNDKVGVMSTKRLKFLEGLSALLREFGIVSTLHQTFEGGFQTFPNGKEYESKPCWTIVCSGPEAEKFTHRIGFAEKRKQDLAEKTFPNRRHPSPHLHGLVPDFGIRKMTNKYTKSLKSRKAYVYLSSFSNSNRFGMDIKRETLRYLDDLGVKEIPDICLDSTHSFTKIKSIEAVGNMKTYDLSVPDGNSYVVNGIVSHNTCNLPENVSRKVVSDCYLEAWKSGCKGFTVYRKGSRDAVLKEVGSNDEKPLTLTTSRAPLRPDKLKCDVHHTSIKGQGWIVFVGLMGDKPYEIFAGTKDKIQIPKSVESGWIEKHVRKTVPSFYDFLYLKSDGKKTLTVKDMIEWFDNPEHAVMTRMISLGLRHGADPTYLVNQLQKDKDSDMQSFNRVIARVLKKYIVDGTKAKKSVFNGDCDTPELCNPVYQEGCLTCLQCGNSKCG